MDFEEDDFSLASGYGWTDKYLLVYGGSCVWRPKLCHLTDNTVSRFCLRLPPQYSPPPSIQSIYNHMYIAGEEYGRWVLVRSLVGILWWCGFTCYKVHTYISMYV